MYPLAVRARCVELHAAGWTHAAIARELGMSYNTARRYALQLDSRRRTPPCPHCGGELRRQGGNAWLCLGCGQGVTRWAAMTPEQRARSTAKSIESQRRRQRAISQLIKDAKAQPCADCGVRLHPNAMHLDHVRGEKRFAICEWPRYTIRVETVREEIAKCDVRCANCHALRHVSA